MQNSILKIKNLTSLALVILSAFAVNAHADVPATHFVPVSVQKLNYDSSNMMITASGMMPNMCTAAPRPELRKTADPAVLQLVVSGEMHGDVCMTVAMVGNTFELAFDIRSLKFDLADLHVDVNGTYKIIGQNGSLIAEINFAKVAYDLPFASHQISGGILSVANDGRVIAVGDGATVEVRSPMIDLKKYIGQPVDLSGFVVNAHSDDFSVGRSQIERPLFLLTGLNTTTR